MSQIYFVGALRKSTLANIYSLVGRRRKFLIDSPAKFRLLASKSLLLEVTNRSRQEFKVFRPCLNDMCLMHSLKFVMHVNTQNPECRNKQVFINSIQDLIANSVSW